MRGQRWLLIGVLAAVLVTCVLPVAQAQGQTIHVVADGENLFRIALRYGTTVDAIMAANNLSSAEWIYVGQELLIPGESGSPSPTPKPGSPATNSNYVVQRGDTLSAIAMRQGVSLWALLRANGIGAAEVIYPGQRLMIPGATSGSQSPTPTNGQTYVVHSGDTLSTIAKRFGTTDWALAQLNGILHPSLIFVGQVLRLPTSSEPAPPVPSGGSKRIVIDLSEQHLWAYEGERAVYSFVCSSGRAPYYTRSGEFQIQSKIPNAYGSTWGIWMPSWLGIYWAGGTENGIHALPILANGQTLWSGYLGQPVSYGCIVLGTYNAQLLYNWVDMGTPVSIRP